MVDEDAHLPQRAGVATLMDVLATTQPQTSTTTEVVRTYTSIGTA
jgi:hypothetical protein